MAVFIGTSGWSYRSWENGAFYPRGLPAISHLRFYATRFAAVETNSTFYGLPSTQTCRRWHDLTPPQFRFAIKASRLATHVKKLADPEIHLARLLESVKPLGEKLAVILLQLPPRWKQNLERLHHLLEFLSAQTSSVRIAMEFRDASWLSRDSLALLRDHNAALVQSDHPDLRIETPPTADFTYIRRHGPDSYPLKKLHHLATLLECETNARRDTFLFFNNDTSAFAPRNAQTLIKLLAKPEERRRPPCMIGKSC